jgi:hypothetical protein
LKQGPVSEELWISLCEVMISAIQKRNELTLVYVDTFVINVQGMVALI